MAVNAKKVKQTPLIPPPDHILSDRVTTTTNPLSNPSDGQFDSWQLKIDQVKCIATKLQAFQPRREGPTGKRRLECKISAFVCELTYSPEHDPPSGDGDSIR